VVSQLLTLYTTPVVYLALDALSVRWRRRRERRSRLKLVSPEGT
jgi:hypothetical protein